MARFRPLRDRLLIKQFDGDTTTDGGIIIPDSSQQKELRGEVVAVGPGVLKLETILVNVAKKWLGLSIPNPVHKFSVGDEVSFDTYAGTAVMLDGEEYRLMLEQDVLGIIERADDE